MNLAALAGGVLVAGLVVRGIRAHRLEASAWGYPAFLATFPAWYWGFALLASDLAALWNELLAGVVFIAIARLAAWRRARATLWLLAAGYVGHAGYDVLHDRLVANAGVPAWWPEFCGSVDVLLGLYVAWLAIRRV